MHYYLTLVSYSHFLICTWYSIQSHSNTVSITQPVQLRALDLLLEQLILQLVSQSDMAAGVLWFADVLLVSSTTIGSSSQHLHS